MCLYLCASLWVYMYVTVCAYVDVCVCVCICVYVCVCMCVKWVYMCICVSQWISYAAASTYIETQTPLLHTATAHFRLHQSVWPDTVLLPSSRTVSCTVLQYEDPRAKHRWCPWQWEMIRQSSARCPSAQLANREVSRNSLRGIIMIMLFSIHQMNMHLALRRVYKI